MLSAVELFSGCGGLAYGLCQSGIIPDLMVEFNESAVRTLEHNAGTELRYVSKWKPLRSDIRQVDWLAYRDTIDVVAGGPPCQPFSIGGKHRGMLDARDMWPEAIRAVHEIRPRAFLFENVRGLLRDNFSGYFEGIKLRLRTAGEGYDVAHVKVNAADYGAAQQRHRVMVAGISSAHGQLPAFPQPTHSRARLLWDQWVTGEYWEEHGLARPSNSEMTPADRAAVARMARTGEAPATVRWRTVRDALSGLGPPSGKNGHVLQPGARVYVGHTGSPLDMPSKALKAGTHGVPGGENMLRSDEGPVRYFTIREAARLQGLPDGFHFPGSWTESMRQLGNAVPTELASSFGSWLAEALSSVQTGTGFVDRSYPSRSMKGDGSVDPRQVADAQ
jgi:DNA (cytosine-5)-methyltransferase 1